ncbi:fimbrial protein [Pseudomonas chlororaphis]|nr:fimbrial protein [Pseudomonas chlororaphis]
MSVCSGRLLFCISSVFLFACFKVNASCTVTRSDGAVVNSLIVTLPLAASQPFDPNVPDGTVIYSSSGAGTGLGGRAKCTSVVGDVQYRGIGPVGKFNTYSTPVAGIGIRIRGGINTSQWWPQQMTSPNIDYSLGTGSDFTVELVKTGPVTASGQLTGLIGTTTAIAHGSDFRRISISGSLQIKPKVPSCSLLTPNISVSLGKVSISSMTGPGVTTSSSPLEIRLKCSGGNEGSTTRMFLTLTDAVSPGNRSSNLSLLPGPATASGVSVQILRGDGTPVSYGPDSAETGNPNQWQVGEFGNVMVIIPFKARYIQTATSVRPGSANAAATFTMSYQ